MSLSIDVHDNISPKVFRGRALLKLHIWWLNRTTIAVPSAIKSGIQSASNQLNHFNHERNAARWIALTYEIRNLWEDRDNRSEINDAIELFRRGWRLLSDWPLRPPYLGSPVFVVKLGRRLNTNRDYIDEVFNWCVQDDARPVPIYHVYRLLGIDATDAETQELAWKICFWLSFLTESELTDLTAKEIGWSR